MILLRTLCATLFSVAATISVSAFLIAADETAAPELRARQLFYTSKPVTQRPRATPVKSSETNPSESKADDTRSTPAESPASRQPDSDSSTARLQAKAPYLALRYSLVQPGANGALEETDTEKKFHSGESFRLKMTSNSSAFLYVVMQGSVGNWEVLYPSPALAEPHQRIIAGEPLTVPSDTNFQFDKDPGTEHLFIVLSRNPEASFDHLIQSVKSRESNGRSTPAGIQNVQMASLRQTLAPRGIVREHVSSGGNGGEEAVYVANVSLNQNSRVITDIVLKHE